MFETPLWQTFLDRFRIVVGANYASLIFRPPPPQRPSAIHLWSGEPSPPLVERLYRESLHAKDPFAYHDMEEGRVYSLDEKLDLDDPRHREYQAELLAPSGVKAMRTVRVTEPSGVAIWLTVSRPSGDFDDDAVAVMRAVAPHLRRALRSFVALERERFKAGVAGDAIHRLSFGWMSLDAAGQIIEADGEAERLLAKSGMIARSRAGVLTGRTTALAREIATAIRAVGEVPRPRALILSRDPWLDMLLVPAGRRGFSPRAAPATIAYVHGDSWSAADRCEQLGELFELLPSEARLALALSRGMRIAEAAAELGLTVETARNYSKKIYAKMGARGQPDLIRFIHRSVLMIA